MRLRNIPDATERIAQTPCTVTDPQSLRGKWKERFSGCPALHVEIGSGKGRFITTLAQRNPEIGHIALERYATVLVKLVRKIPDGGLRNLAVVNADARDLASLFEDGELDRIYLNFSDPWPKKKHAERRLTYRSFLDLYRKVLSPNGEIHFKTDNRGLFDFSLEEFLQSGWELSQVTFDLHGSPDAEGNVQTEYEERFSALGHPIHRLVATPIAGWTRPEPEPTSASDEENAGQPKAEARE